MNLVDFEPLRFMLCLAISLGVNFIFLRKHLFGILDPWIRILIRQSIILAVLGYFTWVEKMRLDHFVYVLFSYLFLLLGMQLFYKKNHKPYRKAHLLSSSTLPAAIVILLGILVLNNLVIYYLLGIPVLLHGPKQLALFRTLGRGGGVFHYLNTGLLILLPVLVMKERLAYHRKKLAYASRKEYALVDERLYLPKDWAKDKIRRKKCGVPKHIRYQTRHELALDMLKNNVEQLPHRWIAGDDEMGRSSGFRRDLRGLGEQYLLVVPSNTTVRDLNSEPPAYGGRGQPPKQPFQQVSKWREALSDTDWTKVDVRDGEKGPLTMEIVKCRVVARTERSRDKTVKELLIVTRSPEGNNKVKYDYYLSNAPADTPLEELARVIKAEHRIEDCLKRAKSEAGLSDYEVRTWAGWHHHQTLSLIALWFLIVETRREKKIYPCTDGPAGSDYIVRTVASSLQPKISRLGQTLYQAKKQTQRACSVLSLQAT